MENTVLPDYQTSHLSGTIAAVEVHRPETGFCVLRVTADGHKRQVKVVGLTPRAQAGEYIEATGNWSDYGGKPQFRASELRLLAPRTSDGVVRLLGSGIVKGVGKAFAKKLGAHFGDALLNVIRDTPHLLEKVDGIGRARRQLIEAAWASIAKERDVLLFLASHGIGGAVATRLYRTYGERTVDVLRRDPYRLCQDVDGIGFRTADTIAGKVGIALDSPLRLRAGVLHAIQILAQNGDCAADQPALVKSCVSELGVPASSVHEAILGCVTEKSLIAETLDGETLYFLPRLLDAEKRVAAHVARLARGNRPWPILNNNAAIDWVQKRSNITFSQSQIEALNIGLSNRSLIVTGGPGTGKSTLLKSLLTILEAKEQEILLAAPYGRSARRMSETTGRSATTIHRLLGYNGHTRSYTYHAGNPLPADLVVVDEFSTLGLVLSLRVLDALKPGAGLLMMGDVDQLLSIEPGAVLHDLIRSGSLPVARLTENHRQSEGSGIVVNAQLIRQGLMPIDVGKEPSLDDDFVFLEEDDSESIQQRIFDVVCRDLPERGYDPRNSIQVLTPMHRGAAGTHALNNGLQQILRSTGNAHVFGSKHFYVGDKVMQTENDTERDVSNGDIGLVQDIDTVARQVHVAYDGRVVSNRFAQVNELTLAWSVSAHKSIGSEWPVVVIALSMEHFLLLDRRLLYTAVTRARVKVILIGQRQALSMAITNSRSYDRRTRLELRIRSLLRAEAGQ